MSPAETVTSSIAPSVGAASIDIEDFAKPSNVFTKERKASEIAVEVQEAIEEKKSSGKEEVREAKAGADIVTTETPTTRRTSSRTASKAEARKETETPATEEKETEAEAPDAEKTEGELSADTAGPDLPETPVVAGPSSPVAGTSAETTKTTASERFEDMLRWLERNNAGKLDHADIEAVEVKPGKYELQASGMPVVFKEITVC